MKRIQVYIRTEEDGFIQVIEDAQEFNLTKPLARAAFLDLIQHGFALVSETKGDPQWTPEAQAEWAEGGDK